MYKLSEQVLKFFNFIIKFWFGSQVEILENITSYATFPSRTQAFLNFSIITAPTSTSFYFDVGA